MKTLTKSELLEIVYETIPGISTLETQNSDALDFHDIHVDCLADALQAAYQAGAASVQPAECIESNNEGYGFYGTMGGQAAIAWPLAVEAMKRQTAGGIRKDC